VRRVTGPFLRAALLAACGGLAAAAGPEVTARLEAPAGEITVGDPVVLTLKVTHPPGAVFDFPDVAAALSGPREPSEDERAGAAVPLVMVDEVKPVETQGGGAGQTWWSIRLRLFQPGANKLPALKLVYRLAASAETREVLTDPVVLTVKSVLGRPDEPAAGNKGQWVISREWWPLILWSAGLLALGAALFLAVRRFRRRARPVAVVPAPVVPATPPWERALADLERLIASPLLAQGRVKEFHVVLSEIIKRYLGERHGFDALDRTTEEVTTDLERLGVVKEVRDLTRLFLEACDLVKFAKHRPERARVDETVDAARRVIERDRPAPIAGSGVAA
jgi:hypothetical protein